MNAVRFLSAAAVASALSLGGVPQAAAQDPVTPAPNVLTTAEAEGFTQWRAGVRSAGLDARLETGTYTVLAADDAAYARVPTATRSRWTADPAAHRAAVGYTVLDERLTFDQLRTRQTVRTIDGRTLAVRTVGDQVWVGDALVTRQDIAAGPGVIHGVDRVIVPPAPVRK
jgi:uncharacterized surface protein with fasciclin (FAS1) repeats